MLRNAPSSSLRRVVGIALSAVTPSTLLLLIFSLACVDGARYSAGARPDELQAGGSELVRLACLAALPTLRHLSNQRRGALLSVVECQCDVAHSVASILEKVVQLLRAPRGLPQALLNPVAGCQRLLKISPWVDRVEEIDEILERHVSAFRVDIIILARNPRSRRRHPLWRESIPRICPLQHSASNFLVECPQGV